MDPHTHMHVHMHMRMLPDVPLLYPGTFPQKGGVYRMTSSEQTQLKTTGPAASSRLRAALLSSTGASHKLQPCVVGQHQKLDPHQEDDIRQTPSCFLSASSRLIKWTPNVPVYLLQSFLFILRDDHHHRSCYILSTLQSMKGET